jgi:hypothetical protein
MLETQFFSHSQCCPYACEMRHGNPPQIFKRPFLPLPFKKYSSVNLLKYQQIYCERKQEKPKEKVKKEKKKEGGRGVGVVTDDMNG